MENKTAEEIYNELLLEYLSKSFPKERLEEAIGLFTAIQEEHNFILKAMEQYGKQQYNQGIKDAVENVITKKIGNSGSWYDAGIDKESILILIKK